MPSSVRDHVDHPKSLYAATKRANELMAHVYSHLYGLPTTGLRFFTVYGPWGRPDMAPFLFTKALFDGTPIKAFNHGDLRRDFTFIDDVIDAVVPLIEVIPEPTEDAPCQSPDRSSAPYRIYNVGNQRPVELRYLIELIERYTERKAPCLTAPMQPGDVVATYADVSELAETLGFCPRTSIEDGLRNFVSWYCDHYRPRSELKSKVNRPLRR
jgi:UDP-glucuronate 4-epimerase